MWHVFSTSPIQPNCDVSILTITCTYILKNYVLGDQWRDGKICRLFSPLLHEEFSYKFYYMPPSTFRWDLLLLHVMMSSSKTLRIHPHTTLSKIPSAPQKGGLAFMYIYDYKLFLIYCTCEKHDPVQNVRKSQLGKFCNTFHHSKFL